MKATFHLPGAGSSCQVASLLSEHVKLCSIVSPQPISMNVVKSHANCCLLLSVLSVLAVVVDVVVVAVVFHSAAVVVVHLAC